MNNQKILEKAIAKAKDNGLDMRIWCSIHSAIDCHLYVEHETYKLLLTDHEFCKAFWGDKKQHIEVDGNIFTIDANWVYNLQQMVVTDNWLEYIEQFLEEK